jgi:hypothetical protein
LRTEVSCGGGVLGYRQQYAMLASEAKTVVHKKKSLELKECCFFIKQGILLIASRATVIGLTVAFLIASPL